MKQMVSIDDVRAAMSYPKWHGETQIGYINNVIAALTTPKLRDDCPVMYDWDSTSGHCPPELLCGWASDLDNSSTNVRALILEDTLMEIATALFKRVWSSEIPWDVACIRLRAKINEYKFGNPDE